MSAQMEKIVIYSTNKFESTDRCSSLFSETV